MSLYEIYNFNACREHALQVTNEKSNSKIVHSGRTYEIGRILDLGLDSIELLLSKNIDYEATGWLIDYFGCLKTLDTSYAFDLFDLDWRIMIGENKIRLHRKTMIQNFSKKEMFKWWFLRIIFQYPLEAELSLFNELKMYVNRPTRNAKYFNFMIKRLMDLFALSYTNKEIIYDISRYYLDIKKD